MARESSAASVASRLSPELVAIDRAIFALTELELKLSPRRPLGQSIVAIPLRGLIQDMRPLLEQARREGEASFW